MVQATKEGAKAAAEVKIAAKAGMTKAKAEAKANMKAKASVAKVKAEILAKVEASVKAELEAAAKAERLRQEKVYRTLGPFRFCHQKGAKRGHVNAEELGRFQNSGFVLVLCEQSSMAATAGRQPTGLAQPLALDANVTPAKKEFPDEGALCYLASPSMQFVELAEKMLDVCSTGAVLALGQIALHEADHTRAGISSHGPSRLLPNGTLLGSLLNARCKNSEVPGAACWPAWWCHGVPADRSRRGNYSPGAAPAPGRCIAH